MTEVETNSGRLFPSPAEPKLGDACREIKYSNQFNSTTMPGVANDRADPLEISLSEHFALRAYWQAAQGEGPPAKMKLTR